MLVPLLIVYLAGAVAGLIWTDAPFPGRLVLAILWPAGAVAFVVTVAILLAASLIAFPIVAGGVAVAGVGLWWLLRTH
jgi:hypothetical protein